MIHDRAIRLIGLGDRRMGEIGRKVPVPPAQFYYPGVHLNNSILRHSNLRDTMTPSSIGYSSQTVGSRFPILDDVDKVYSTSGYDPNDANEAESKQGIPYKFPLPDRAVSQRFRQAFNFLKLENPRSTLDFDQEHREIGEWLAAYKGPYDVKLYKNLVTLHHKHQVQLNKMKSDFCRKGVR